MKLLVLFLLSFSSLSTSRVHTPKKRENNETNKSHKKVFSQNSRSFNENVIRLDNMWGYGYVNPRHIRPCAAVADEGSTIVDDDSKQPPGYMGNDSLKQDAINDFCSSAIRVSWHCCG